MPTKTLRPGHSMQGDSSLIWDSHTELLEDGRVVSFYSVDVTDDFVPDSEVLSWPTKSPLEFLGDGPASMADWEEYDQWLAGDKKAEAFIDSFQSIIARTLHAHANQLLEDTDYNLVYEAPPPDQLVDDLDYATLQEGDTIETLNDIVSNDKEPVDLPAGTRGRIVEFSDVTGSALVDFVDYDKLRWVAQEDFQNLLIIEGQVFDPETNADTEIVLADMNPMDPANGTSTYTIRLEDHLSSQYDAADTTLAFSSEDDEALGEEGELGFDEEHGSPDERAALRRLLDEWDATDSELLFQDEPDDDEYGMEYVPWHDTALEDDVGMYSEESWTEFDRPEDPDQSNTHDFPLFTDHGLSEEVMQRIQENFDTATTQLKQLSSQLSQMPPDEAIERMAALQKQNFPNIKLHVQKIDLSKDDLDEIADDLPDEVHKLLAKLAAALTPRGP